MESNIDDIEKNRVVTNIENMFLAGRAKKRMADMAETSGLTLEEAIKLGYNPEEEASLTKEEKLVLDAEFERFMSSQEAEEND